MGSVDLDTNLVCGLSRIVLIGIVVNVVSTVSVVLANKYVYEVYHFKFMITLSCLHFIVTTIATRLLVRYGFFQFKDAQFSKVLPVALGSLGSVAFMNLNLAYNSVGFYQISKLMCIPVTLVMQYQMFGTVVSKQIMGSLAVILFGVGVATVTDVNVSLKGLCMAAAAVFFTVLGQIFTNSKQKELDLDAMQLLYHASPIISCGMFALVFIFDDVFELIKYPPSLHAYGLILLTCIFAIGVNTSNYVVIGKTSPVTYQVVGHSKTCLLLTGGFVLFNKSVDMKNICGITIAVIGVVIYTELKRSASLQPGTLSGLNNRDEGLLEKIKISEYSEDDDDTEEDTDDETILLKSAV